jgi:hypothetical protein
MLNEIDRFILGNIGHMRHTKECAEREEHHIGSEHRFTPLGPICRFVCAFCGARSLEIPTPPEELQRILKLLCESEEARKIAGIRSTEGEYVPGKNFTDILVQEAAKLPIQGTLTGVCPFQKPESVHDQMTSEDVKMAWDLIDAGFRFEIPPVTAEVCEWSWRSPRGRLHKTTQAAHKNLTKSK